MSSDEKGTFSIPNVCIFLSSISSWGYKIGPVYECVVSVHLLALSWVNCLIRKLGGAISEITPKWSPKWCLKWSPKLHHQASIVWSRGLKFGVTDDLDNCSGDFQGQGSRSPCWKRDLPLFDDVSCADVVDPFWHDIWHHLTSQFDVITSPDITV